VLSAELFWSLSALSTPNQKKGWIAMSVSVSSTFPTGPAIGQPFPDFTLPDQHGQPVHFSTARGGKRAMVVVHRSASW